MQKVMNTYILKTTGLAIFVIAAIIGVYALWPARSPDTEQTAQSEISALTSQPSTEKIQPKNQLTPEDFQLAASSRLQDQNPRQHQLRRKAALLSTIYRNPHTPDAAKARVL